MKKLILMRHGKAEKDAASGEDFDRVLSTTGHEEAAAVARALKADDLKPDLALVSPAARTLGTFAEVESVLGTIPALRDKAFYHASAEALRRAVENHEDEAECLLLVGHNPGLQYLVLDYLFAGAASVSLIEKLRGSYPTATATVFDVDVAGRPIYDGVYIARDLLRA